MRSLLKLSLAALLALVVAGTAFAADVKWSGNIGAGFGMISYGSNDNTLADSYSEYVTSYEANIRATVEAGPVTAIWRLRSRGHQSSTTGSTESGASSVSGSASASQAASTCTLGGADSNGDTLASGTCTATNGKVTVSSSLAGLSYAEIWWKPTDAFTVGFGRFQGQAWSQPMSGTYLILNPVTVTGVAELNGAPEYFMNWTGIDGIDLEFNAGVAQVGVAIASECRPACALNSKSAQTITPHVTAKFGDIGVRAMLPATSGKDGADDAHTGGGYQIGVSWSGMQGVYVGADIQSFTLKEAGGTGSEDQTTSGMGLRVDFSGFQLGYWTGKVTNVGGADGAERTGTWMKLAYFLKVSDAASIIPEYTTATGNPASDAAGKDVTNTLIRLVGNVTF